MLQGLLQTTFSTLFHPSEAFQSRAHRSHWWQAATLLWLISSLLTFSAAGNVGLSAGQMAMGLVIGWGSTLLCWWICSMLLHFSSEIFGGQGRLADTMTSVGLACLPLIFIAPMTALPNLFGTTGYTLALLGWMGLIFWVLALLTLALSAAQRFSLDRSIGALILGVIVSAALVCGSVALFVLQLFFWGAQLAA